MQNLRNYTLAPAFKSLQNGNQIAVYKSIFTVGIHTQISWLASEEAWVVASQHASVFFRNKEELKLYETQSRYAHNAPFNIAKYWINYFENNIKDKESFKMGINGRTLCGTYIDNKNFSIMLKYKAPTLIFHIIVDNSSDEQNCLLPEHCYEFFKLHDIKSAPLEKVGDFDNFDSLINSLKEVHEETSNLSVKDTHRGSVLYFVEKSTTEMKVLTLGKIQAKEYQILTILISKLAMFWKPNEKITGWSRALQDEYNNVYEDFIAQLDEFNMPNAGYYRSIADMSFNALKEDLALYSKFKKSTCDFYIDILNRLGYRDDPFVIEKPNKPESKSRGYPIEEEKQGVYDNQFIVPPAEEIVEQIIRDQPFKSEKPQKFRKGSQKANRTIPSKVMNTKIEEKPAVAEPTMLDVNLEDIIGSVPDRSSSSKPKKTVKKAKTKKNTKQGKSKLQTQKVNEESQKRVKEVSSSELRESTLPQNDSEYELIQSKTSQSASKQPSRKQSSKPVSRKTSQSIEDLQIDEVDQEPAFKLQGYEGSNSGSSVFDVSEAKWLNNVTYTEQEEIDPSLWFLLSSSAQLNGEISYVGKILHDPNTGTRVHVLPVEYTKQSEVYRRFGNNLVFGLKQQRSYLSFKNKSSGQDIDFDGIIYSQAHTNNFLLDAFDHDAFNSYVYNSNKKSYKYNPLLYFSNVDYWFGHFRILSSVFKCTQLKFMNTVLNTIQRTDNYYYNNSITSYVFGNMSMNCMMNLSSLLYTSPEFTSLVIESCDKNSWNELVQELIDFSKAAPDEFFE